MKVKDVIRVDDDPNGVFIAPADVDGFFIKEIEGDEKVYIYYSEIGLLVDCLNKIRSG